MKKALILRTCKKDLTSWGGFVWPESGLVEAPDWDPEPKCGNGLHGFLWGEGDGGLADWNLSAKWLVAEVDVDDIVDLGGKVKFPRATVVHCGDRKSATDYIIANGAAGRAVIGGTATAGDYGTATIGYRGTATVGDDGTATAGQDGTATAGDCGKAAAGNYGTATVGDYGTATVGYRGTAAAGYGGTATAGSRGTATAGYYGTATVGDDGTATAGYYGTATVGDDGTATAGYGGTATAGYRGTATAGDYGTATAGHRGTATAGYRGMIRIDYYDGRRRTLVGYIGEDGMKPDTPYKIYDGKFLEAE